MNFSAETLSTIIRAALQHYHDKEFGQAIFVETPQGTVVQFVDAPPVSRPSEEDPAPKPDDPVPLLNAFDLFGGLNGSTGDDGGFGGGTSGGAGASGSW